jgi:hypothetical protein
MKLDESNSVTLREAITPSRMPCRAESDFTPHWDREIDIENYHDQIRALSSGGLREALISANHFHYKFILGNKPAATPAMRTGNVIHAALLERERYAREMVLKPDFNRRSNAGKAEEAAWLEANEGKIIVSESDAELIDAILSSVERKPHVIAMLDAAEKEVTGLGYDESTRLLCRIRPDAMLIDDGMILDLKTSTDASPRAFERSIYQYGYHIQAAFYLRVASQIVGRRLEMFRWIVVEKTPPYEVAVYDADSAWLSMGDQEIDRAVRRIDKAMRSGVWDGYQQATSQFISPQLWMINQCDEQSSMEGA